MATKVKGFETRETSRNQMGKIAHSLRLVGKSNLADMVQTHGTEAENTGAVKLSRAHWQEIDDAMEVASQMNPDLTINEAVDFLADAGMQVLVIDEHGVHDGTLMPDDSVLVQEQDDNPTEYDGRDGDIDGTMTDEQIAELDGIMAEADAELEAPLFPTCGCGCGNRTKGGRYIPGHDAKHKGNLMRTAHRHEGTPEGDAAILELQVRGWYKFYPAFSKNETKRERRANVARCDICGRPLFDEESVQRGIGPICMGKH